MKVMNVTCPICRGSGEILGGMFAGSECQPCWGTGTVNEEVPADEREKEVPHEG